MLQLNHISFSYPSSSSRLFEDLNLDIPPGWTGLVGANGSGKTTLLMIAAKLAVPDGGHVKYSGLLGYCPQRSERPDTTFEQMLRNDTYDPDIEETCRILGIEADWHERWCTLSQGEQKRAQIATVLAMKSDVLLVDEPTNHLDEDSAKMVFAALKRFKGTGILVSHDRNLLDDLCVRMIFLESGHAILIPGNYSKASAQKLMTEQANEDRRGNYRREIARLETEMKRRVSESKKSDSRVSKRNLARKDSDGRAKINLARLTGKDGTAGKLAAAFESRVQRVRNEYRKTDYKKEYALSFRLKGEQSHRNALAAIPRQTIAMGSSRSLEIPSFTLLPNDRIGISGPNGSGKTTFLRFLISQADLPEGRLLFLPQEITESEGRNLINEIRKLPSDKLGELLAFVSCLGSAPARLLETEIPSPGELRKLFLALGLTRFPWLVIMDEPTNHLDLPAVELLEKALENIECALILVSHDKIFLDHLTVRRFRCRSQESGRSIFEETST